MYRDPARLAVRRRKDDRSSARTKAAVRPRKCAATMPPLIVIGRVRSTTETVSLPLAAIGHRSIVLPAQGCDSAAPVARMRQANDYVAWRYLAMQLSKPSVIILPGRLRPMKTIRLSRFSPGFHGR